MNFLPIDHLLVYGVSSRYNVYRQSWFIDVVSSTLSTCLQAIEILTLPNFVSLRNTDLLGECFRNKWFLTLETSTDFHAVIKKYILCPVGHADVESTLETFLIPNSCAKISSKLQNDYGFMTNAVVNWTKLKGKVGKVGKLQLAA
ncbi:uncharacterized protein LOC122499337 [Leptopilina heterotoma]|uniref:uncharacterized protein LOC122499337 n=1 Tax=Leptopilina heterotoma TaxID=63436 RepID=UPI001CA9E9CD|nr:uncharacterized protein LOC122499337 [Leptopilina heterotoma]